MNLDWSGVDHVTKVDPAKPLPGDLDVVAHTDLVVVGGSDGVTEANTIDTIERVADAAPDLPVLQEPYSGSHVSAATVDAADYVAIPAVFNGDRANFVAKHVQFFAEVGRKPAELLGADIPLLGDVIASRGREAVADLAEKVLAEGYVVQNVDSKAAAESGVDRAFSADEVAGAALATESFYDFPVFYVEYSGTYGGPEDVEAAATYLADTALLYGGGIESRDQTAEVLDAGADAVVVGDCFHDDPDRFLDTIP
ncbi:heptaprenylglyceryl phosphate synthase [Halobacterium yunchengense]|uniref:heptaprenylglyceryl phosphate synthase n=1 Tax=Halobacterium yunchengense TaxID=3108497 RepID=UPI00300BDED0